MGPGWLSQPTPPNILNNTGYITNKNLNLVIYNQNVAKKGLAAGIKAPHSAFSSEHWVLGRALVVANYSGLLYIHQETAIKGR